MADYIELTKAEPFSLESIVDERRVDVSASNLIRHLNPQHPSVTLSIVPRYMHKNLRDIHTGNKTLSDGSPPPQSSANKTFSGIVSKTQASC